MCQDKNNPLEKKKQHITKKDRILIEYMYNTQGKGSSEIAKELKPSSSAIGREIKRGLVINLNSDLTGEASV